MEDFTQQIENQQNNDDLKNILSKRNFSDFIEDNNNSEPKSKKVKFIDTNLQYDSLFNYNKHRTYYNTFLNMNISEELKNDFITNLPIRIDKNELFVEPILNENFINNDYIDSLFNINIENKLLNEISDQNTSNIFEEKFEDKTKMSQSLYGRIDENLKEYELKVESVAMKYFKNLRTNKTQEINKSNLKKHNIKLNKDKDVFYIDNLGIYKEYDVNYLLNSSKNTLNILMFGFPPSILKKQIFYIKSEMNCAFNILIHSKNTKNINHTHFENKHIVVYYINEKDIKINTDLIILSKIYGKYILESNYFLRYIDSRKTLPDFFNDLNIIKMSENHINFRFINKYIEKSNVLQNHISSNYFYNKKILVFYGNKKSVFKNQINSENLFFLFSKLSIKDHSEYNRATHKSNIKNNYLDKYNILLDVSNDQNAESFINTVNNRTPLPKNLEIFCLKNFIIKVLEF